MAEIEKKSWPKEFEEILSGEKKWDLRIGDFETKMGDTLVLKEWDPDKQRYTGRELRKRVSFVRRFGPEGSPYYLAEEIEKYGFQIIQLADLEDGEEDKEDEADKED